MSHRRRSNSPKKPKKRYILLFITFIIAAFVVGYLYILEEPKQVIIHAAPDPVFTPLENPDTSIYLKVVSSDKHVEILTVAKKFYGNEEYWPYILEANEFSNPLSIEAGAVIKIPKIDSLNTKSSLAKAKLLGEKLLEELSQREKR